MKEDSIKEGKKASIRYEELEEVVRERMQGFIQEILEEELTAFLGRRKSERVNTGIDRSQDYRNGYGRSRKFCLLNGTVSIRRPRLRDGEGFESKVLPLFKRQSQEVEQALPELYLHGLALGDFEMALRGLLGEGAPLSSSSIQRLKEKWEQEYAQWKKQDLSMMKVVYLWADGIYVKAGLEKEKAALLVIIGSLTNGQKVLLACESGYRESAESWKGVLRDLRLRGLQPSRLTIADGHLGIWAALREIYPESGEQRCWNHKITNVLNEFPKKKRSSAIELLQPIPYASSREECEQLRDIFIERYREEYPKAVDRLLWDWERMVTFYSFPEEHWIHLRTTNVVESPFSSIRLRTDAARRYKKIPNATAMIWKLLQVAQKSFRTLKGYWLLQDVYEGKFHIKDVVHHQNNTLERISA